MAKLFIEVDTSKKESTVKLDGKKINNVSSVYMSLDDYFNVEISQVEELDEDTRKVTRIVANKLKDFAIDMVESENFPGMFEYKEIQQDFTTEDLSKVLLKREV